MKAYRITTKGREGGVAFAVQPHREVRPESGLVGIVEHIVVNKKVTALMWYRLMSKHESEWPYGIPKRDSKESCYRKGGLWLQLDYAHRQRSRAKQAINL